MGLLDALRGKTKQIKPNLDALFALPTAALTMATQLDLTSSGVAGVCYKLGSGASELTTDAEIQALLEVPTDASAVSYVTDDLGFRWVVIQNADLGELVTRVHGVHSTLSDHGLGPRLLCSVFGFVPATPPGEGAVRLVYLTKSGTFYPFAPRDKQSRDNELEIRVRTFLSNDLPIEPELSKWMALWGLPVT